MASSDAPPPDPGGGPPYASQDRVVFGSLLAACVGFLAQLCDKTPDRLSPLWLASVCFAVALPILSTCLLLDLARFQPLTKPWWRLLFDLVGVMAAVIAVALIFFNITAWAGGAFIGMILLAGGVARAASR